MTDLYEKRRVMTDLYETEVMTPICERKGNY